MPCSGMCLALLGVRGWVCMLQSRLGTKAHQDAINEVNGGDLRVSARYFAGEPLLQLAGDVDTCLALGCGGFAGDAGMGRAGAGVVLSVRRRVCMLQSRLGMKACQDAINEANGGNLRGSVGISARQAFAPLWMLMMLTVRHRSGPWVWRVCR